MKGVMSNQFAVSALVILNPLGVQVIEALSKVHIENSEGVSGVEWWGSIAAQFLCVAAYVEDNDGADFIPFGTYADLKPEYSLVDNVWRLHCSTGRYSTIEKFRGILLPAIAADVKLTIHDEMRGYEEWSLVDGKVVMLQRKVAGWDNGNYWGPKEPDPVVSHPAFNDEIFPGFGADPW
jgi:hypothetical protein